jgi:hypothetical protein
VQQHPVEEVAFDRADDAEIAKGLALEEFLAARRQRIDKGNCRDRLRNNGQIGMLEE